MLSSNAGSSLGLFDELFGKSSVAGRQSRKTLGDQEGYMSKVCESPILTR